MDGYAWFWLIVVVSSMLYVAMMVWFLNGWRQLSEFEPKNAIHRTKVSVIVPFKNEHKHLKPLLESLIHQRIQTNEFEIILVDDNSDDDSANLVKQYEKQYRRVLYVKSERKGKKQALKAGVSKATGQLIVLTDADCTHHENWLAILVDYYEYHQPNMIIGPVAYPDKKGLFRQFQRIEFASLVASGAGAAGINHPVMCNGANLAFKKQVYEMFEDPFNDKYTSGDDVFLMHQFKAIDAEKVHFIKAKEAMVYTASSQSLKTFIKQRVRWVSKSGGYHDGDTKFTAAVVFITALIIPLGIIFTAFNIDFYKPLLFVFILKTIMDTVFLSQVSSFFYLRKQLKWLPVFQLVYCFYVAVIAVLALLSSKKQ